MQTVIGLLMCLHHSENNNHKVTLQFWIFSKHCFHATFQVAVLKIHSMPCMPLPTAQDHHRYMQQPY